MRLPLLVVVSLAVSGLGLSIPEDDNGNKCRLSINYKSGDLKEPQPLLLKDNSEIPDFLLPTSYQMIELPSNGSLVLACPGPRNRFQCFNTTARLRVRCHSDTRFSVLEPEIFKSLERPVGLDELSCTYRVKETVRKSDRRCLGGQHQVYEVGFEASGGFVAQLEICRDEETLTTYYSRSRLTKEIISRQSGVSRPDWSSGRYFRGLDLKSVYQRKSQVRSLAEQLGSEETALGYLGGSQYFQRGHLAAKGDFVYGSQQLATFWLLNTAPQWGSFNAGNWQALEASVRWFAGRRALDLDVYTGVHGQARLLDVNGNPVPIYLHANATSRAIVVPRFFWKVLHDRATNRAVAFVGVNEPHGQFLGDDAFLCRDLAGEPDGRKRFGWLSWNPDKVRMGLSYVCEVGELRRSVKTVPELGEVELLV